MTRTLPTLSMVVILLAGCGGATSTEGLSDALLTVGDLSGDWTENRGDPSSPDGTIPASGSIPEDKRELLPSIEICDAAAATGKAAADSIEWEYFRQFDMTPVDPFDPPSDREGHKIFLQEFMLFDGSSDLERLTADLFPAIEACLGDIPAGEEGPGTASKIEIGDVGDESLAVLTQIEEAGGRGQWFIYNAIVRKGSVLLSVVLGDVFIGNLRPEMNLEDFDAIVQSAVAKL